jgi:hypothetical protein
MRSILLMLAAVALAGCGTLDSGVEDLTLRYGGGITEEKAYKGMIEPGTTNQFVFGSGTGDDLYHYPRTQRSWIAGETEGVDRPPVEVVTADGVRMKVDYALYFRLNPQEEVLRRFHEDIGLKEGAWTEEGWLGDAADVLRCADHPPARGGRLELHVRGSALQRGQAA